MLNSVFSLLVACMPVMTNYVLPFFGLFVIHWGILTIWRCLDCIR